MAKKDPTMRAEFWFGGRKNKKLVEIKYNLSDQDQFVEDFLQFLEEKNYNGKKMWPERKPDFVDEKGRKFFVNEGLIQLNNSADEILEFFIRSDEKTLKGKKPHVRIKKINSRRRQVSSEEYEAFDDTYNHKVMDEIMNHMLLTNILEGDEE